MIRTPYKIEWSDSYGSSPRWESVEDITPLLIKMVSFGYIIKETDSSIAIAPHYGEETPQTLEQVSGVMVIPKSCVTKITELTC